MKNLQHVLTNISKQNKILTSLRLLPNPIITPPAPHPRLTPTNLTPKKNHLSPSPHLAESNHNRHDPHTHTHTHTHIHSLIIRPPATWNRVSHDGASLELPRSDDEETTQFRLLLHNERAHLRAATAAVIVRTLEIGNPPGPEESSPTRQCGL